MHRPRHHPIGPLGATALVSLAFLGACEGDANRAGDPVDDAPAVVTDAQVLVVHVTGDDYEWHIRYPGPDGIHGSDDDVETLQHLHLPANTSTRLELRSRDYLYTLTLPHVKMKEIAVPDLLFALEFTTATPGRYELRGDQMCGFSHESLIGDLVVQSRKDFKHWLDTIAEDRQH